MWNDETLTPVQKNGKQFLVKLFSKTQEKPDADAHLDTIESKLIKTWTKTIQKLARFAIST